MKRLLLSVSVTCLLTYIVYMHVHVDVRYQIRILIYIWSELIVYCLASYSRKFYSLRNDVRRMGRYMVPRVKNNNPLGTQNTVSLDFDEEYCRLVRAAKENPKFHKWSPFIDSRRHYLVEILPIRRKTLYTQSIIKGRQPLST